MIKKIGSPERMLGVVQKKGDKKKKEAKLKDKSLAEDKNDKPTITVYEV